jgi:uncharacterized protein YacL
MDLFELILFTLGILIGNIVSHRYIRKLDWEDTIIYSMVITIIIIIIVLLLFNFGIIDNTFKIN